MLFETGGNVRAIEARQFPPLEFLASAQEASRSAANAKDEEEDGDDDPLTEDLAATLQSMAVNEEPKKLNLPPLLWSGPDAVVDAGLFSLARVAYETLSRAGEPGLDHLDDVLLEGGVSVPDEGIAGTIKRAKVGADQFPRCCSNITARAVRTPSNCRYEERRPDYTLFGHICAASYP